VRLTALVVNPAAFASTHTEEVDQTDEMWEAWAVSSATGRDQAVFVAETDGRFVGLAGAFRMDGAPSTYHLFTMWTDPQHRREGQGAALTEAVIAWAQRSGGTRIDLWVAEGNETAQRMYERLGFERTGSTQPLPHQQDVTELEMSRSLDPPSHVELDKVPAGYIELTPMTAADFERYLPDLVTTYADDLMRADDLSAAGALERAATEVAQLLPQRETTPFHHVCILRAGLEDVPVGTIWFGAVGVRDHTVTCIYDLAVDRSHRGRGFGTAALSELEEWSRLQHHDAVAVHVFEHNTGARHFYERSGYAIVDSDPGHLRMEKSLE
jgi:ribosomal protein S18 acetylase RimI-like enzyme